VIPALMPTYNRADLAFERGEGAYVWTDDGRRFLDFGSGIATTSLGHAHPHLVKAISEQAAKVMHVSNLYRVPQAEKLAARHVAASFADSVFFCNSGAEANEGMIKAVRKYHSENGHPEKFRMICFEGAFHGRTLATLSATGNEKYLAGFGPPVEGFDHVPFGNMNAVRDAIGPGTGGIMIEPIQGEGGVRPADLRFLRSCARSATSSGSCSRSTRCRPAWGAPASSGPMNGPASSRTSCPRPRASAAASRSAPSWPRRMSPSISSPARTAPPMAVARWPARPATPCWTWSWRMASWPRWTAARYLWKGLRRWPPVIRMSPRVQGAGLLVGLKLRPSISNGEMQAACVAEGLLTVAAGHERAAGRPAADHHRGAGGRGVAMIDRACTKLTPAKSPAPPSERRAQAH
jgi:acetylornithine/N-succinyldiaminopimelate aminotransferase